MLRSPIPNAEQAILENIGSAQLITLFESCLKTGLRGTNVRQLAEAWGTLFSNHYLSAEELVDEMQRGEQRLGARNEQILKEFVKADCRSGGVFVLNVIKKGGNLDRAALIMIADLEDLAGIEHNGTTAIHLLADACDKWVRPALIRRAGKRLLSGVFDSRGIPVIFTIFSLGDLSLHDLDAIAALYFKTRMLQHLGKIAVIGHDQQAGSIDIQTSDRIEAVTAVIRRQDINDGTAAFFIADGGDNACRFMQHEANDVFRFQVNLLAGENDTVFGRVHEMVKRFGGDAVHFNQTLFDSFRHAAPRADTGFGQGFYQRFLGHMY